MRNDKIEFKRSWYEAIKEVPEANISLIIEATLAYILDGVEKELPPLENIAFKFIKAEYNANKSKKRKGAEHWNWKGGVSSENHIIRNSSDYKKWRLSIFARDKYTCRKCNKKGGVLHAHHIMPFSLYPNLRFDINNGITVCKQCHDIIHKTEREWEKNHS